MMGGFHFNDRRYADDDLTLGSIDPYQVFRIFHEIRMFEWETKSTADIAYMIDQSHNLKDKIEAMIQTVCTAQELYARAALVDHERLASLQSKCALVDAEETFRGAFWSMCEMPCANGASQRICRSIRCRNFAPAGTWSGLRPSDRIETRKPRRATLSSAAGPLVLGASALSLA